MKVSPRASHTPISWFIALGIGLMVGRHGLPASPGGDGVETRSTSSEKPIGFRSGESGGSPQQNKRSNRKTSLTTLTAPGEDEQNRRMIELSDILNTSNRIERTRQMLSFIDQVDDGQMAEIIDGFRDAGWIDYNRGEYTMLISAWMDRDPFTAIAHLDKNGSDGWTRKTAISAWAADNPEAAANAIQGLEDEGKVNDWVVGLIEGIARNDPEGALRTLKSLPGGDTKLQAIREILPEVVIRGADFAGDWIEQIDEPKLQRETAKRLAHSLARRDPESASDWISKISAVETRRDASEVVSEVYAQEDLDGAKLWAENLPQDTMTEAAEGVAKYLARKDPAEAALWLQKLGNDPDLDEARFRFLQEAGRSDPKTALENVSTLSQAKDQERYYRDILGRWRKQDQNAAVAWAVANSETLPPKVLKSVLPKEKKRK